MTDIDFHQIAPRGGDKRKAFEELCCQLACRKISENATFTRLHGAGGDGGIECFSELPDGSRIGWQAKYVFDIDSLLRQATKSLRAALQTYPTLTRYILCFPFDLTGPTSRPGKSGYEKFLTWKERETEQANAQGISLEIEGWPENKLRSILIELDTSGGISRFFFDKTLLSHEWFADHISRAKTIAGPRYSPELNLVTDTKEWFTAFGRTAEWTSQLEKLLKEIKSKHNSFNDAVMREKEDSTTPKWPDQFLGEAHLVSNALQDTLATCNSMKYLDKIEVHENSLSCLKNVLEELASLEEKLTTSFEEQHGKGTSRSPSFRQYMAEYMVSFPTSNIDVTRDVLKTSHQLYDWIASPKSALGFHSAFVLSGDWGVGKTHTICDVASQRLEQNLLSCIVFGHDFNGEPDPWTRLAEKLGLPAANKSELLDMLNTAAETSGQPLIIFIDAINETRPLRYWKNQLLPIIHDVSKRPHLRICLSCRTPYLDYCLPDAHHLTIQEHPGFKGSEHIAAKAFFEHYELKPPVAPTLQPEFSNPLYLRLACETLKSRNMDSLPIKWYNTTYIISAFLKEKEKEFAEQKETSPNANIVTTCLRNIAHSMAELGATNLARSAVNRIIQKKQPEVFMYNIVDWLVNANLLIEEVSNTDDELSGENTVRLAFERFGDFLVASNLLLQLNDEISIDSVFKENGQWHSWVKDMATVEENYGVLSALSILIPERFNNKELSMIPAADEIYTALVEIVVTSIPWRKPDSFSPASQRLLLEALYNPTLCKTTVDNLLSISWRPSIIDAMWFSELLNKTPLAKRDSYWCRYLYKAYEDSNSFKRLIDVPVEQAPALQPDMAERWAIMLLWFTAAADLRIKNQATRALVKILIAHPTAIPELLKRFLYSDDDAIRERLLLASYGALIVSQNEHVIKQSANMLSIELHNNSQDFNNAIIRDHIRSIYELAYTQRAYQPQLIESEWPLELPTEAQVNNWETLLHFKSDEFYSDFFKYSMECLRPWMQEFPKLDMGKWILQRVAHDFKYEDSGCENYDNFIRNTYGGGRGKPIWAERIAKKYMWIAMYQLASRLHDYAKQKEDNQYSDSLPTPLILLEERKLDPTLLIEIAGEEGDRQSSPWWIATSADTDSDMNLTDEEWLKKKNGMPTLEELLTIEHNRQNWHVLAAYLSWKQKGVDNIGWDTPHRYVWTHIESFLVPEKDFSVAYECIRHRNFFGKWMPEGTSWLYGFAGEYPWATPFNPHPDEDYGYHGFGDNRLPVAFQPSWNNLVVEWEYDSSLQDYHMLVPAPLFFSPSDLFWNGKNGYRLLNGKTVFQDPSVTTEDPSALIGDANNLLERLDKLGLRLIWTLLGEKMIYNRADLQQMPVCVCSQTAYLERSGALQIDKQMFFDNHDQDTGPKK